MSHEPVTVVASGGVPVVDGTPLSGTALNNPTSYGVPVTPTTGARLITIVASGGPPVVFIDTDGVTYMPGGVAPGGGGGGELSGLLFLMMKA